MRVRNWNPQKFDGEFFDASMERLNKAAHVIKEQAISNLRKEIGRNVKTTNISHGPYKTGKHAGQDWTARDFGSLLASIRVTKRDERYGSLIAQLRNVRVYAGHYLVWWADIFEFYKPYMRPAVNKSKSQVRSILENG